MHQMPLTNKQRVLELQHYTCTHRFSKSHECTSGSCHGFIIVTAFLEEQLRFQWTGGPAMNSDFLAELQDVVTDLGLRLHRVLTVLYALQQADLWSPLNANLQRRMLFSAFSLGADSTYIHVTNFVKFWIQPSLITASSVWRRVCFVACSTDSYILHKSNSSDKHLLLIQQIYFADTIHLVYSCNNGHSYTNATASSSAYSSIIIII